MVIKKQSKAKGGVKKTAGSSELKGGELQQITFYSPWDAGGIPLFFRGRACYFIYLLLVLNILEG